MIRPASKDPITRKQGQTKARLTPGDRDTHECQLDDHSPHLCLASRGLRH